MKALVIFIALLCLVPPVFAGASDLYFLDSDWHRDEKIPVSVVIIQDADFVAVPVTITSSANEPELRNKDISESIRLFREAAEKSQKIKIDMGIVYLTTKKTSFFKSYGERESQAQFNLLVPFEQEKSNVYNCADEIYQFIAGIRLPDKAKCNPGGTVLVVDNPEKYKSKLLHMIYDELKKTQDALNVKGKVVFSGMESPVTVKQIDEQRVGLYIKYAVSIELLDNK